MRCIAVALTLFLSSPSLWALSAQQLPPRDVGPPKVGTASISGVVVADAVDPAPIARATVVLTGPELGPGLLAITGDNGRFELTNLPPGTFRLGVSKPAFVEVSYGQRVPGRGTGVPIAVAAGQRIEGITVRLPKGAVITGTIRNARGQPIRHVPILVLEYRMVNGQRTLWSLGALHWPSTDAQGLYRVYGLSAGSYLVYGYRPGGYRWFPGQNIGPFNPTESGGSTSSVPAVPEVSPAEIEWAVQQLARVSPSGTPGPSGSAPRPQLPYAPTFYPGTAEASSAIPVTVGRGEERTGVDFTLVREATSRVVVRVMQSDGQPATNVYFLFSTGSTTAGFNSPDGKFSRDGVAPGRYIILAQGADRTTWAKRDLLLSGEELVDVEMVLQPALHLSGLVAFDAGSLTPPRDLNAFRVSLKPDGTLPATTIAVGADARFEGRVVPGRYRLDVLLPDSSQPDPGGRRWALGAIAANGRELTSRSLVIEPDQPAPSVVITLTDRFASLSGTLLDEAGRPASGVHVAIFPADRRHWIAGSLRRPVLTSTATDGTFRFDDLRPDRYHIVALTELDEHDLDEVLLSQLAANAMTVTLADGERRVQNLKISP